MSAMVRTDPTCELPPRFVMRTAWRLIRFASSSVAVRGAWRGFFCGAAAADRSIKPFRKVTSYTDAAVLGNDNPGLSYFGGSWRRSCRQRLRSENNVLQLLAGAKCCGNFAHAGQGCLAIDC